MVSSNSLYDQSHMMTFENWLTDYDIHVHPPHIIMASLMQLKLQSCATSYNPGTQYCEKLYIMYMAVWPRQQKKEPKMQGNPKSRSQEGYYCMCKRKEKILTW
jgi:hypothetical protein